MCVSRAIGSVVINFIKSFCLVGWWIRNSKCVLLVDGPTNQCVYEEYVSYVCVCVHRGIAPLPLSFYKRPDWSIRLTRARAIRSRSISSPLFIPAMVSGSFQSLLPWAGLEGRRELSAFFPRGLSGEMTVTPWDNHVVA